MVWSNRFKSEINFNFVEFQEMARKPKGSLSDFDNFNNYFSVASEIQTEYLSGSGCILMNKILTFII